MAMNRQREERWEMYSLRPSIFTAASTKTYPCQLVPKLSRTHDLTLTDISDSASRWLIEHVDQQVDTLPYIDWRQGDRVREDRSRQ